MSEPEDLTFDEFKNGWLALIDGLEIPRREGSIGDRMYHFLKSGCTEAEFKRWLGKHIWEFPDKARNELVLTLAADAFHRAALQAEEEEDEAVADREPEAYRG